MTSKTVSITYTAKVYTITHTAAVQTLSCISFTTDNQITGLKDGISIRGVA